MYPGTPIKNSQHLAPPTQNILVNIFLYSSTYLNIGVNKFNWHSMQWAGFSKHLENWAVLHTEDEKFGEKIAPLLIPHYSKLPTFQNEWFPKLLEGQHISCEVYFINCEILGWKAYETSLFKCPVTFLKYV